MRQIHSMLLLAVAIGGCAGTPLGPGGNAEIVFAQPETIRIRWNPQRTNERDVRTKAMAYCGGRDVEELDSAPDTGASGSMQAKTWRCDNFPGTGGGM